MIERPLQTTLLPIYSKKEVKLLEKNRLNFRRRAEMVIIAIGDKISRKEVIPKRNTELTNEHKATCVLAIVFACFFICWAPFFCANLAFGFCGEPCALPPTMEFFFLWLGYFSSIINPLIYTIFNRQFRRTFLRIICCQCTNLIRNTYVGNFYSRRKYNDDWTTVDRPDSQWEQDRCTALSYNTNLHERKPSRQEHCVQSIHSDTSSPNRKIDLLEKTEQATMVNKEAIMNDQSQNTLSDICMIASSEGGKLSKHNKDSKNLKFFHNHGNVNVLKFSISEQGLAQAILFICFKPLREAPS
ncbi:7 transmembrane receptor (rhodopsin family) protein [Acanthocheilonema viteae]